MRFSKRIVLALSVAAMASLTLAPLAMAGVVGSNHDMPYRYSASPAKNGACSYCHIPHKAGGSKLWAGAIGTGTGWRAEVVSNLCYSCHGVNTYTGAQELNPFNGTMHGRTVDTLTGFGDATLAQLTTAGVPFAGDGNLKCTSCHNVHDNGTRPFLRYSAAGVYSFDVFCETCHINRKNTTGQETLNVVNGFSQHPTDQVLGNTGDTEEGFVAFAAEFAVTQTTANITGATDVVAGWNLGGKRNDALAGGNFGCATCHAVHGNETTNFASLIDGTTTVSTDTDTPYNFMAVRDVAPGTTNAAICTGCHASTMPAGPGAGGTSHPVGTDSSTWSVTGVVPATLTTNWGSKWGNNGNPVIVCQSCHDMHYATSASSLLRGTLDGAGLNSNCNICHGSSTMANHHPAGIAYTGQASPTTQTTAMTWSTLTPGTAGAAYTFPGGLMTCVTCHGGGGKAHNNSAGFPALAGYNGSSEMCFDCHTANPSAYTANAHAGALEAGTTDTSHFVGTIATTSYKYAGTWASGYSSKWGDAGAAIICESCHTLKLSLGNPSISANTAVAGVVSASVRLLLESSGNLNATFHGTSPVGNGPDLCTRCHGGQPSGGATSTGTATHPALSTGMAATTDAAILAKLAAGNSAGTVSTQAAGIINCESCHRPHDAAQGSGAIILEGVGTDSTKVLNDRTTGNGGANYANETPFCNMCHSY